MNAYFLFLLSFLSVHFNSQAGDEADTRHYPNTVLFINIHKNGEKNGCTGLVGLTGKLICGNKGAISEVTWSFLRKTKENDIYTFTREYPSDASPSKTSTKEVTYTGKDLVLWHDEVQEIILKPKGSL